MNLADYRNNARSLQALVIAVPLLSKLLEHNSDIPFPPMGDETLLFRLFAMLMVGVSVALPYAIPVKRAKHWVAIGLFFALMGATATYLRWEQNYVVTITFPASEEHPDGAKVFVTRGDHRADLRQPYASMPDDELIRNTGLTDARLGHIYTKESLVANRQKLFWAYLLPLIFFELLLGVIARTENRPAQIEHAG